LSAYTRHKIETHPAPDVVPHPSRFRVDVQKHRLIGLILRELVEYRGNLPVVLSRPCVYGVFSGPVGGLAPREHLCVGCLRCTMQYPDIVRVRPNPDRERLGDSYLGPDAIDTILYEARSGRVPVRGAGYRGGFGGAGWDGMWTDMSEIVRPTRDGIHGREFISTITDIGEKPAYLSFKGRGGAVESEPKIVSFQVPFLFDAPPRTARSRAIFEAFADAARRVGTAAIVPASLVGGALGGSHVVPLLGPKDEITGIHAATSLLFTDGWDASRFAALKARFPEALLGVRIPADFDLLEPFRQGVRVFHLAADCHGRVGSNFLSDLLLQAHQRLVQERIREEVTLIGSGGIVLAEHVPKAIICGADAVALDTALCVALQGKMNGECRDPGTAVMALPRFEYSWAVQRIVNLSASWRDQLLEILGAMGLRESRRLRGEVGRSMLQRDVERESFAGIEGYAG
jgi:Conserved region in glutamate synthase